MDNHIAYLLSGAILGLSAGFAPGPLLTLVLTETLRHGRRSGIYVALAPLVTDLPIIVISLYVLSRLSHSGHILGVLTLAGACFIAYMAYDCFTSGAAEVAEDPETPRSLGRGVLTNILSPHPYLFWMTVGGPIVIKAAGVDYTSAGAFLSGFYGLLVGTKIFVALVSDHSRRFVGGRGYVYILKSLGVALLVFALLFMREGLMLLGAL